MTCRDGQNLQTNIGTFGTVPVTSISMDAFVSFVVLCISGVFADFAVAEVGVGMVPVPPGTTGDGE